MNTQPNYKATMAMIPSIVWVVGAVTLLINVSSTLIISLMPTYMKSVLNISFQDLGMLDGIIEGSSWMIRIFSGPLSDMLSSRKPILVLGLLCATTSRLIFPYAGSAKTILLARIMDRIGNGLQASPREALIGDVAPTQIKATCYGLRQTLGLIGSCLGGVLAIAVMMLSDNNYKMAFGVAIIPAIMALLLIIIFVKEPAGKTDQKKESIWKVFTIDNIKQLNANYLKTIVFAGLFMLSYYSSSFPTLQAQKAGLPDNFTSLVMVTQNLMGFLIAFPMGFFADKFGYRQFLVLGCILSIVGNLMIAQTSSLTLVLLGIGIWGAQLGMMSGIISSKITEHSPAQLRATAFGLYFGVNGLMIGISNHIAGSVASMFGLEYVFYVSTLFAIIALMSVKILPHNQQ